MRSNVANADAGQSTEFGRAPTQGPSATRLSKAVKHQYELKAGECVPRHTTVFAPTFLPHHCLYANCTSRAAKTSHDRIVHNQGRGAAFNIPTTPNFCCASRPSNRFEGPDISPCHPPFCSVTKRNLDSRSAHRFLRNSRVLMPDNSGALWLSPSPSARQFIHMSLQSKLQSFRVYFIVSFHFCSLMKLTQIFQTSRCFDK